MPKPVKEAIDREIRAALTKAATPPQQREDNTPPPRWTLKRLVKWVKERFEIVCSRETLRRALQDLGFSWKKARKLLNRANPEKRAAYLQRLTSLLDDALHERALLVYLDEAHIHLDADEGYGWSICGQRFWISSSTPGLAKVSFYGLYLYNLGQVRIWP